ncbi:MAG: signal peptidase I [Thermoprotei archaeon]|nr:MAG: signal peptidase I [Thermoprotei archaeon]RLF02872.1 MAG: signal peptidase I [Thermoprotei archaeon]
MKVADIIEILLFIGLVIFALSLGKVLSALTGCQIPLAVVSSYSMDPTLHVGDIIVSNKLSGIERGDIVIYRRGREFIVHRVIKVLEWQRRYVTKGDANPYPDAMPISMRDIEGKVFIVVPYLGVFSLVFNKNPFIVISYFAFLAMVIVLTDYLESRKRRRA